MPDPYYTGPLVRIVAINFGGYKLTAVYLLGPGPLETIGYLGSGFALPPGGAINPATFRDVAIGGLVQNFSAGTPIGLYLYLAGSVPADFFTSLTIGSATFNSADAAVSFNGTYTEFLWNPGGFTITAPGEYDVRIKKPS